MPTNANTFNSRVTSEALEAKFRDVFPAQGGAELVQDLFASGVIQPVVDFSSVAEGSVLPQNLQTAWDFATGNSTVAGSSVNLVTNSGFWQVGLTLDIGDEGGGTFAARIYIDDGLTSKTVWRWSEATSNAIQNTLTTPTFVVFLRSGDTLLGITTGTQHVMNVWYRQIADVNGGLVNPLGFTFS